MIYYDFLSVVLLVCILLVDNHKGKNLAFVFICQYFACYFFVQSCILQPFIGLHCIWQLLSVNFSTMCNFINFF